MNRLADFVLSYRKALFWGWLVIVPILALGIPRNELNDVLVHFFDESVEFRQDTDFMDERLSGNTLLEYSLHASAEGGVTDPLFLAEVSKFADWYREQPPVRHVAVITDTFRHSTRACMATIRTHTGFRKVRNWRRNIFCFTRSRFRRVWT